jgi:hypothetical protein
MQIADPQHWLLQTECVGLSTAQEKKIKSKENFLWKEKSLKRNRNILRIMSKKRQKDK